ncbi:MAG: VWA domain-containing protein [Acidobacteria bacterium]|nr:VWA domain-containing protein [Acidobacteriota bacterium]
MMTRRITELARSLRCSGVPVSAAEAADAARALRRVGLRTRDNVRLALRAALVKEHRHFPLFEDRFAAFFSWALPGGGPGKGKKRSHPGGEGEIRGTGRGEAAGERSSSHRPPSPDPGESPPAGKARPAGDREREERRRRRRRAEAVVAAAVREGESAREDAERRSPGKPDLDLRRVDLRAPRPPEETRRLEQEVEKLARRLVSRESLRRRKAGHGRPDLRRTLAAASRTGGAPFRIVRRRRAVTRWKLLVLCDVSGSMRRAAGLFLGLAHALQGLFSRTRSLIFVDRPVDATPLFERLPAREALAEVLKLPGLNSEGLSDYGSVFYRFLEAGRATLDRNTVVVILGDARTNRFDPQAWALEEIRGRVKRVVWLNPEPRKLWGVEDSAVEAYRPFCDDLLPCGTLDDLASAADRLLK